MNRSRGRLPGDFLARNKTPGTSLAASSAADRWAGRLPWGLFAGNGSRATLYGDLSAVEETARILEAADVGWESLSLAINAGKYGFSKRISYRLDGRFFSSAATYGDFVNNSDSWCHWQLLPEFHGDFAGSVHIASTAARTAATGATNLIPSII